jgi:adenine phosphoribosyltransferase
MKKTLTPVQKTIANAVPNIPNFPIKGIQYKDVTPILAKPRVLDLVINELAKKAKKYNFDCIVAPESRGFFFGVPLAQKLHVPFIPIRKKGKLPRPTISITTTIEYSKVSLEVHKQDIKPNTKVLIVDDLLATGGTTKAIVKLLKLLKAKPVGVLFVIELPELKARKELIANKLPVEAIIELPGK